MKIMKKIITFFCALLLVINANAQNKGIINNTESEHIKFKSIDIGDCQWTEGFWADKWKICEEVMVPHMGELLTGDVGHALNNFKIAAGEKEGKHKGMNWHDGDFYKWMEASIYIYAVNKDKKILQEMDEYIEIIGKAQEDDGFLSTQITLKSAGKFENRKYHELYNSGHLITAACIHNRVTGQQNFLDIAIKHADYLYELFQPQPEELARFGFNQTQIMGLVELYRTTKDKRYLELAEIFINMRGKSKPVSHPTVRSFMMGDMVQERTPLRKETEAVGHAVLALYFYAGAADVYAETGEKELVDALDRLWENVTEKKMYVTGAVGQAHHGRSENRDPVNEAFIREYMMPNLTAYNETCANICNSMFSYRMLGIHGEAKYADIMELVLYNSALSGIDLAGKHYFYANPLRKTHDAYDYEKMKTEFPDRQPYLNCFCCPPNLVRTVAKSPAWAYSLTKEGLAVNLYGGNILRTKLLDGSDIEVEQVSQYPWQGDVTLEIKKAKKSTFDIMLRIPAWAKGTTIKVNGKAIENEVIHGTYAIINRQWKAGDKITMEMPMEIKMVEGNPKIEEVRNQVAVKRGPVVYCVESPDLPENTSILDVYLSAKSPLKAEYQSEVLGGVTTIQGDLMIRKTSTDKMYSEVMNPEWKSYKTQLIPYFSWSNRGAAEMTVWLPVLW